jgi:hypothetical protein
MIFRKNKPVEIEEQIVESFVYTEEQLMARLKFFIGICLSLTLFGIVFVVLYSLIFVTQPLNAISPIDQKFFELIVPIATFLTGTLSGIMLAGGDKDAQMKALEAATRPVTVSPPPSAPPSFGGSPMSGFGGVPLGSGTSQFTSSFGGPTNQFNSAPPTGQVITGFGGKPAPAPAFQPEL